MTRGERRANCHSVSVLLVADIHDKAAFISQKKLEDILSHEDLQQVVTKAKWHRRAVGV